MSIVITKLHPANYSGHFRAFSLRSENGLLSPFIGVDHYWMNEPTFPPHHHAYMSAVSYLPLDSETGIKNRDSIGTNNLIQPGGLHWTTAGQGIMHEEIPAERGKTVHGLQIFVALAPSQRNIAPFPLTIEPNEVPVIEQSGAKIRIPVGRYGDKSSQLTPPTDVTLLDITLETNAEITIPLSAGHTMFAIPIFGTIEAAEQRFDSEDLRVPVFPAQATPRDIIFKAPIGSVKFALFSGLPLPIV